MFHAPTKSVTENVQPVMMPLPYLCQDVTFLPTLNLCSSLSIYCLIMSCTPPCVLLYPASQYLTDVNLCANMEKYIWPSTLSSEMVLNWVMSDMVLNWEFSSLGAQHPSAFVHSSGMMV
jgi:hypothetical protein